MLQYIIDLLAQYGVPSTRLGFLSIELIHGDNPEDRLLVCTVPQGTFAIFETDIIVTVDGALREMRSALGSEIRPLPPAFSRAGERIETSDTRDGLVLVDRHLRYIVAEVLT
jgi:hypothetical protein